MGVTFAQRSSQAAAVAAIGVPGILLAHLLTTGLPAGPGTAALVVVTVLGVAALVPARSATGLAAVTVGTQFAGHAVLLLTTAHGAVADGCIPAVGRGATLGLHLALLRADGTCPTGTFAPGAAAGPTAAALTAVLVAFTILAGHALAAGLTGVLLTAARRATRVACAVRTWTGPFAATAVHLRVLLGALRLPTLRVEVRRPPERRDEPVARTPQWHPPSLGVRGPPSTARPVRAAAPA